MYTYCVITVRKTIIFEDMIFFDIHDEEKRWYKLTYTVVLYWYGLYNMNSFICTNTNKPTVQTQGLKAALYLGETSVENKMFIK